MEIKTKIAAFILGIIFFLVVLLFVRKKAIPPTAVILWLSVTFFLISIPLIEPVYKMISVDIVGFDDSRHIIYIVLIGFLLVYNFYLTIKLSATTDYVKSLIKELGILESKVCRIKKQ